MSDKITKRIIKSCKSKTPTDYDTKDVIQRLLQFEYKIADGSLKQLMDDPLQKAILKADIRRVREWLNDK